MEKEKYLKLKEILSLPNVETGCNYRDLLCDAWNNQKDMHRIQPKYTKNMLSQKINNNYGKKEAAFSEREMVFITDFVNKTMGISISRDDLFLLTLPKKKKEKEVTITSEAFRIAIEKFKYFNNVSTLLQIEEKTNISEKMLRNLYNGVIKEINYEKYGQLLNVCPQYLMGTVRLPYDYCYKDDIDKFLNERNDGFDFKKLFKACEAIAECDFSNYDLFQFSQNLKMFVVDYLYFMGGKLPLKHLNCKELSELCSAVEDYRVPLKVSFPKLAIHEEEIKKWYFTLKQHNLYDYGFLRDLDTIMRDLSITDLKDYNDFFEKYDGLSTSKILIDGSIYEEFQALDEKWYKNQTESLVKFYNGIREFCTYKIKELEQ